MDKRINNMVRKFLQTQSYYYKSNCLNPPPLFSDPRFSFPVMPHMSEEEGLVEVNGKRLKWNMKK